MIFSATFNSVSDVVGITLLILAIGFILVGDVRRSAEERPWRRKAEIALTVLALTVVGVRFIEMI